MNNASLELGGTNWAEKDASLLGYTVSDDSGRFSPQEFTFARGSNLAATRIGKTGLIEKGRENLLVQSNSFDTWSFTGGSSVTANQAGYDGTNDAWLLTDSGVSASYGIYRNFNDVGVLTSSIYAKAASTNNIELDFYGDIFPYVRVDLTTGAITNTASHIDAQSVNIGNGWWRISVTGNLSSTSYVRIGCNGAGSIYIQDAQVELGLAAGPYIPTTTTTAQAGVLENTPRLNYTTGVANPYLLLEPSRTNFTDSSEYAGGWAGINANITKTDNATTSPEGVDNAVKLEGLTTSSTNQIVNFGATTLSSISVVGKTYTASVYLKPVNPSDVGDDIALSIQRNSGDYEGLNVTFEIDSADWKRYDLTYTFTGAGAGDQLGVSFKILRSDTTIDDIYVYGVQLEEGSWVTSYIPTYSVTQTRGNDETNVTGLQSKDILSSTQGTMFFHITDIQGTAVVFNAQTANNLSYALRFVIRDTGFTTYQRINNVQTTIRTDSLSLSEWKIAMSWNGTNLITSLNGTSYIDTIDASIASQLDKIARVNPQAISVTTNQILVFTTQLTEAKLNALTTI